MGSLVRNVSSCQEIGKGFSSYSRFGSLPMGSVTYRPSASHSYEASCHVKELRLFRHIIIIIILLLLFIQMTVAIKYGQENQKEIKPKFTIYECPNVSKCDPPVMDQYN